ncbi:(2Fe-2S)-binding protein [Actinacidiphila sp. bgisy145]|uniref:(2Fe-2S)-binding protein n=1 Tax=Actinacidiphila sp. bgisy145 TaxID=3413792 RepID=UPI003EB7FDCD
MHGDETRAALAELGPFFAVESAAAADAAGGGSGWRSMAELADGSGVLAARVAAVRGVLAAGGGQQPDAVEERVAASVTHLGLVARLLSPYLALAVLYGHVPGAVRLSDLRWQPALGGPYPLALPGLPGRAADPPAPAETGPAETGGVADLGRVAGLGGVADAFAAAVLSGPVRELTAACADFRVSPHVLRGNTASALAGAARMVAAARPEAAARARALTGLLTAGGPLRGAGHLTPADAGGGHGAFRRRSCCLIYRAAPGHAGALCGDCALSRVPVRPG